MWVTKSVAEKVDASGFGLQEDNFYGGRWIGNVQRQSFGKLEGQNFVAPVKNDFQS
jgi:hypothetical protein